jgi:hypothetical protein
MSPIFIVILRSIATKNCGSFATLRVTQDDIISNGAGRITQ